MQPDFTQKLLEWNISTNNRAMPWKGEPDPYRIWLSEIILQQTRVKQGWAYYERFLKNFPDVNKLANAPESEVFKLWEGLGYYTRCSNLIASAKIIAGQHNGIFPSSYDEIIKLKGVGPYTAAAISSFAFNEKRAVVDGNVQRVLARYFGVSTPVDSPEGKKLFSHLAQSLIDENFPAAYNQAIMDFGATICKPRNPLCKQCVQSPECEAFNNNYVYDVPVKQKILKIKTRWLYYFIIESGDWIYIRKRETRDIWQNLHEFVLFETESEQANAAISFLGELLQHQSYEVIHESEIYRQQLTHQRIHGRFLRIRVNGKIHLNGSYRLVKKINIHDYAFPRFINSYLQKSF
ncbi:MAG TPA: A/G-specific adenine glycosylase [Flavitalea sp.]|nr:A/G-specific adenine glycosylase [Flavitalea sp.]